MRTRVLLSLLIGVSCAPTQMNELELQAYLNDPSNGLHKEITMNEVSLSMIYRPAELLITQELANGAQDTKRLVTKYKSNHYFLMSLSVNGSEAVHPSTMSRHEFRELQQTISFRLGEFIYATTSKRDTIPLQDFAHSSAFGMGTSNDVLLVFEKDTISAPEWIQINVGEFGLGLGRQTIRFMQDDIDALPKMNLK